MDERKPEDMSVEAAAAVDEAVRRTRADVVRNREALMKLESAAEARPVWPAQLSPWAGPAGPEDDTPS